MLEFVLKTLVAYLLGTLVGGLILGRLKGVDIRRLGSGNAGATNALRTQGKAFGAAVLLFDVAKGVIAAGVLPDLAMTGMGGGGVFPAAEVSRLWLALACGTAVILGHVYPVWFGFKGGKGVATVVGVLGALEPSLLLPLFGCWFAVILLTGYVSLASMLAGVGLVIVVYRQGTASTPLLIFCIAVAALVIYTHRGNIARLRAGTEHRARRLWLFRSRAL